MQSSVYKLNPPESILDLTLLRSSNMNASKEDIKRVQVEFKNAWGVILDEVLSDPKFHDIRYTINWLEKVLERNVPHGKQTRAFLSIYLYRTLKPDRTEEDDFLNYVTGWIIEMLQTSVAMLTGIMNESETRNDNGTPCWHRHPHVGLSAINDAFLLETVAYITAFKYFTGKNYLLKLIKMFRDNGLNTMFGESLHLELVADGMPDLSKYTESTYKALVKYKTSYYTFFGPVAAAMIRAGVDDQPTLDIVERITLKIGELFQIQDDFLDAYGEPVITGKLNGQDVRDGKITWLVVKALELASCVQEETIRKHYGQPTIVGVEEVKRVYDELGIEQLFYHHENAARLEILTDIKSLPSTIPQEPFLNVVDAIYRREK